MTTHVSRERREAVAAAIRRAQYRWVRMETHTDILSEAMADAALAAALPDKTTFVAVLNQCMVWSGVMALDEEDLSAVLLRDEAARHLLALVYGADDAHDGDQEGAEHE